MSFLMQNHDIETQELWMTYLIKPLLTVRDISFKIYHIPFKNASCRHITYTQSRDLGSPASTSAVCVIQMQTLSKGTWPQPGTQWNQMKQMKHPRFSISVRCTKTN